ncbi:kielin/chordin-like protein isoform X2 [Panulirus ornatus]|uniref:kielin/chordin-like protein isoform X2 n=1 Tax=Panulirus ornatus TaxID=150431 RepID=UPI003A8A43A4
MVPKVRLWVAGCGLVSCWSSWWQDNINKQFVTEMNLLGPKKMARGMVISLVVVMVMVGPHLASARAILGEASSSEDKVDDSNCSAPVHCCRHLPLSSEFIACCNASGCCSPCDNLYVYEGHGVYETREDCEGAYECCVSPFLSDEFNKCCFEHQCCPFCGSVPEGCWYNGVLYPWGSVIDTLPDSCIKLVCGAKLSYSSPYITGVVLKLYHPPTHYDVECDNEVQYECVNPRGIIHEQNSEWLESLCSWCRCEDGHIRCEEVEPVCPPALHPDCTEVPGDCCSTWICHNLTTVGEAVAEGRKSHLYSHKTCIDYQGVRRNVGETWVDPRDPCVRYLCTQDGIEEQPSRYCPPVGPRPHVGCKKIEEDCCQTWHCTGCVDQQGVHHAVGETWVDPRDPCIRYLCTQDGIEEQPGRYCPPVGPRPHVGCKKIEEDCCQIWHCTGCVDQQGVHHAVGETWVDPRDPCIRYLCTQDGIEEQPSRYCPPVGPRPHVGCKKIEEDCCQTWHCTGCVDQQGIHHAVGETWIHPRDPCIRYLCTQDGIEEQPGRHCPPVGPRPHLGCKKIEEDCCQIWHCTGCVDQQGVHHPVGETWVDPRDPCTRYLCTQDSIEEQPALYCPPVGPRPHVGCKKIEQDCCEIWHCTGCVDQQGVHHAVGETWVDPRDPCIRYLCTQDGIEEQPGRHCPPVGPRPHLGCKKIEEDCCQTWHCTGCVDEQGVHHDVGETWVDPRDPCITYLCTQDGIKQQPGRHCPPLGPRPHVGCRTVQEDCCNTWYCTGCVDQQGVHHDVGETWVDPRDPCIRYLCTQNGIENLPGRHCPSVGPRPHPGCKTVEQDCCTIWHCTGCVDQQGLHHAVGETWLDPRDPCIRYLCTQDGIEEQPGRHCPPVGPRPHVGCKKIEEDCCEIWYCSGCVDDQGVHRKVGEDWYEPGDHCTHLQCTQNGIKKSSKVCPTLGPKPRPECELIFDNCCQMWECPGCVDDDGVHRHLGEQWVHPTEPCTQYKCLQVGIEKTEVYCPPLAPRPHLGCRTVTQDCCQVWQCTGCVDEQGRERQHGDTWVDQRDPCLRHLCTRSGIQTSPVDCPHLPPRPHPGCTVITHDCCHTWTCSGCVDNQGEHHEVGQTWTDPTDPCIRYLCTPDGIERQPHTRCPHLEPQPHIGCRVVIHNCCQTWHCSGCVDEQGVYRKVGEEWYDPLNPCIHNHCTRDDIIERSRRVCPGLLPRPHPPCELIVDNCCQRWQCPGCIDDVGSHHNVGEEWTDPTHPCTHYRCLQVGIEKTEVFCPPLDPRPHRSCQLVTENCCHTWRCTGCVDDNGVHHEVGEWWEDQDDPCIHLQCTKDGIKRSRVECPLLTSQPHRGCRLVQEDCCYVWRCQLCIDDQGVERRIGEEWKDPTDPCKDHLCTRDGIETVHIACLPPPPPPGLNCHLRVRPGECCHTWTCREECPDPSSLSRDCVGLHHDQCQRDEECPAGDQCCLVAGCGKQCITVNRPCQNTGACRQLSGKCLDRCGRGEHPVPGVCLTSNCFCCVPDSDECTLNSRECIIRGGYCDVQCRSDEHAFRHLCSSGNCFCCIPKSSGCVVNSPECIIRGGRCDVKCNDDEHALLHVCESGNCFCCVPKRDSCTNTRECNQLGGQCGGESCTRGEEPVHGVCATSNCICCVPQFNTCKFQSNECRNIEGRCDVSCLNREDPVHHLCSTDNCVCCIERPLPCHPSRLCDVLNGFCKHECSRDENPLEGVCGTEGCVCCVPGAGLCHTNRNCLLLGGQCSHVCPADQGALQDVCDEQDCLCCVPGLVCRDTRECHQLGGQCSTDCSRGEQSVPGVCLTPNCVCCVPEPVDCRFDSPECSYQGGRCDHSCRSNEYPVTDLCNTKECLCCLPDDVY